MMHSLRDRRYVPDSYIREKAIANFKSEQVMKNRIYKAAGHDHPLIPSKDVLLLNSLAAGKAQLRNFNIFGGEGEEEPFIFHDGMLMEPPKKNKDGVSLGEGKPIGICMIFSCFHFFKTLCEIEDVSFDGTFKVVPSEFAKWYK